MNVKRPGWISSAGLSPGIETWTVGTSSVTAAATLTTTAAASTAAPIAASTARRVTAIHPVAITAT